MRLQLMGAAIAMALLQSPAQAQLTIDMSLITCEQYLRMTPAVSRDFSAWMSGWFHYQSQRTDVDLILLQKNIASVKAWCQNHPRDKVMSGLQNAFVVPAQGAVQANVNMNNVSCGNWLGQTTAGQQLTRFWLTGYYQAAANNSVLDYQRLQKTTVKVSRYCKSHKAQTLPTAIKNTAG
jgi:hypothetical protein